ncbi:hypothetical protein J2785_007425 [Burkholderia ambifaria]|nr:hypothetical protein [Burkholderia ambifaria]
MTFSVRIAKGMDDVADTKVSVWLAPVRHEAALSMKKSKGRCKHPLNFAYQSQIVTIHAITSK